MNQRTRAILWAALFILITAGMTRADPCTGPGPCIRTYVGGFETVLSDDFENPTEIVSQCLPITFTIEGPLQQQPDGFVIMQSLSPQGQEAPLPGSYAHVIDIDKALGAGGNLSYVWACPPARDVTYRWRVEWIFDYGTPSETRGVFNDVRNEGYVRRLENPNVTNSDQTPAGNDGIGIVDGSRLFQPGVWNTCVIAETFHVPAGECE